MVIVPIRSDNAYVGVAKQSSQGTGVAPSTFVRWLDGSKLELDIKNQQIWEGDGSRMLSQVIKNRQYVKGTIKFNPRPIEMGFFEAACMGTGSDAVTPSAVNTTMAATASAGASTFSLASNAGLTSAGTALLMLSVGTSNEEVVSVTTPGTGAGPYVYTISASGTLKNTHTSGDIVRMLSTHVLTNQQDSPYYTIEFGLGSLYSAGGMTVRIVDCKIEQIKRTSKAGELVVYEVDFCGISTASQGSPATVTFEAHSPFLFTQGVWTINGSLTGDALAVEAFEIIQKNNIDQDIQAESLTLAALIFGNLDISVKVDIIFQNTNLYALTYWNSGTADAQPIGSGSLTLKFTQGDSFHSVQYVTTTLHYTKVSAPEPKKDGKHYKVTAESMSVSNQSANTFVLQTTVTNSQTTAY